MRKKKELLPSAPEAPPGPRHSQCTIRPPWLADKIVSYAEMLHDLSMLGILEATTEDGSTTTADGPTPIEIMSDTKDEQSPEFTGEVPHHLRNWSITETTGMVQLCNLVQATLHPLMDYRVYTPSPPSSVTADEEDQIDTYEGYSLDHDVDDVVLHWLLDGFTVSQSSSPAALGSCLAHLKTPGKALVFVLFYVTHSKCYVLTEHFTPSQASPEYAEVLSYMSMFFMQLGPVEKPAHGMMSCLPGFATPPAVLTEISAEALQTMYAMYICPQMLTLDLLELPLLQESHINSEILCRSDVTMAKPQKMHVQHHSAQVFRPGPALAASSSSSSAQAVPEDPKFINWLDELLTNHFATDIQDHRVCKESGEYGTAYMAFLNDCLLHIIYKALYPTGNQTIEFTFQKKSYWIHRHNIGHVLIGSSNTANNHMSHISNAHCTLCSLCTTAEDKLNPQDKTFKRHLKALLGDTILGPRSTYRDTSSVEYNAVTMLLGHMNDIGKEI
ncbi:hypothetical protein EDD85DRAFT_793314 [Armillaria nabsnona]|nr:hypothetical protein EDD85DRAFT_793314 [Armillaria nabsnona]